MRLIYLVGMDRSGSTLVGEYLGSFPGAATAGELLNTWRAVQMGQRCSCGETPDVCNIWRQVVADIPGGRDVAALAHLRSTVDRQRYLPRYARLIRQPSADLPSAVAAYVDQLQWQVNRLAEATGADILIDTSKSPAALGLAIIAFPRRVSVVQVIRDPRAVAYSQSRRLLPRSVVQTDIPGQRGCTSSAVLWNTTNLEGYAIARLASTSVRVRYEDLRRSPRNALEQLAAKLAMRGPPPDWDGEHVILAPQHVLAGNPSRTDDRRRAIDVSDSWRRELSMLERGMVAALALAPYRLLTWKT